MKIESEEKTYQLQEKISKSRFNFQRLDLRSKDVFARQLITRIPAILRAKPNAAAPVVERLPAGAVITSRAMHGTWFEVQMPAGSIAYIEGNQVLIGSRIAGKRQAQTDSPRASRIAQSPFTMPIEHVVEGLSHYQSRRFEDAYWAFDQFIHWPDINASEDNLASAYRWQGASLMFKDPINFDGIRDLAAFSQAVELRPYDPSVYNIRALARFGITRQLDGVLEDLKEVLAIDNKNITARNMLFTLAELSKDDVLELPDLEWVFAVTGVERTLRTPHVTLPDEAETRMSDPDLEGVRMHVENHTGYLLNVSLVGVVSRSVEVNPGDSRDIDLVEGEYELGVGFSQAVQDRATQVRPMYGIRTYKSNTAYALKFYLNWQEEN